MLATCHKINYISCRFVHKQHWVRSRGVETHVSVLHPSREKGPAPWRLDVPEVQESFQDDCARPSMLKFEASLKC